jgi:NADPH-dependent glutamate synthase beta subunit-like oxidoreductase
VVGVRTTRVVQPESGEDDVGIVSKGTRGVVMKVAVVGKGNVGGGLADRWERAGHDVTRIGRGRR